jgi:hypothetical protein
MMTETLEYDTIRYNPEHESFEAVVRIHDLAWVYSYPVSLKAHLQADYALVARGLVQKAREQHLSNISALRSQTRTTTYHPPLAA